MASLRSQMELAQQAVRDEQQLAERLRQQASVASASAQRRVKHLCAQASVFVCRIPLSCAATCFQKRSAVSTKFLCAASCPTADVAAPPRRSLG